MATNNLQSDTDYFPEFEMFDSEPGAAPRAAPGAGEDNNINTLVKLLNVTRTVSSLRASVGPQRRHVSVPQQTKPPRLNLRRQETGRPPRSGVHHEGDLQPPAEARGRLPGGVRDR